MESGRATPVVGLSSSAAILQQIDPPLSLAEIAQTLDWPLRIQIAYHIAEKLAGIHSEKKVHGDLKLTDVLIEPPVSLQSASVRLYLQPAKKILQSDIRAFGWLVIQLTNPALLAKNHLKCKTEDWLNIVKKQMAPELIEAFTNTILDCFKKDPKERPTMQRIARILKLISNILSSSVKAGEKNPASPHSLSISPLSVDATAASAPSAKLKP